MIAGCCTSLLLETMTPQILRADVSELGDRGAALPDRRHHQQFSCAKHNLDVEFATLFPMCEAALGMKVKL